MCIIPKTDSSGIGHCKTLNKIEKVILANNAPENVVVNITESAKKNGVIIETAGNEIQLATSIGKPFPIASVGYYKKNEKSW